MRLDGVTGIEGTLVSDPDSNVDAGMADIIAESFLDDKNLLVDSKLRLKLNPDAVQDLRSHILGLITERAVGPSRDPKCDEEAEHIPSCSNAAVDD